MTQAFHLTLLASLMLHSSLLAAEPVPGLAPLLPDGKARPSRASVLLLGTLPEEVAQDVQHRMEDMATLYRLEGAAPALDDLLQSRQGRRLLQRRWHAIHVTHPKAAEIEPRLKAGQSTEIVWGGTADAAAIEADLKAALLKSSTPWAELPKSEKRDPARLLQDGSLLADPDSLPLLPSKTGMIYHAQEGQWQFNLHSFITHHEGRFWAIWSSGRVDEDSSSQFIRYATSQDGLAWSESAVAAPDPDGEAGPLRWLASGLYVENGSLYALGCLNLGGKDGKVWADATLKRLRWDGGGWKDEGVLANNCMVYFPPMKVAGRDFFVWRDERAHFFTARSLPGVAQWEVKKHPGHPPDYRMSETSAYADAEGTLHLIIRDQAKTRRLYHSLSFDHGDTWTLPVKTNYPDAVSKNMSGRLSNGWFYLINNPKTSSRDPLTITVSQDGWTYGSPKILRRGSPARRYKGGAKPERSFQYADAMEHDGRLWVIYATNKEDIEVSAFDIKDLVQP